MEQDDSGFDLEFTGGRYFANPADLYAADNINGPVVNVRERAQQMGHNQLRASPPPVLPRADHVSPLLGPPLNPLVVQPIFQRHNAPAAPAVPAPIHAPAPAPVHAPARAPYVQQSPYIVQNVPVHHYINEYSPVVYRRLYDYGVNFIPSYYSYDQRRRLEFMLENIIKKELLAKMSENELEMTIRNAIKNSITAPIISENALKLTAIKAQNKAQKERRLSKKSSRKTSTRKTSVKPARKTSKKPARKTSAKPARKVSKKKL